MQISKRWLHEVKPSKIFQKNISLPPPPWYPHVSISGGKENEIFGDLCFLKAIVLIFLFTDDLKHIMKLLQILKAQSQN